MRLFLLEIYNLSHYHYWEEDEMAYQKVNRPPNAVPDSVAWKTLGLSRATFFRKLKEGSLTAPITRSGTARRWWTPSDIEIARQELEAVGLEGQTQWSA
jgi:predicted DNA-binding transcriptional regulator AlpA